MIAVTSSHIWKNLPVNLAAMPGSFLVGILLITDSIYSINMELFGF